jgi:hypothetical protein
MKKKHYKKIVEILLEGKALIGNNGSPVILSDELKMALEKVRGKQKPSKLTRAVMTVIKEQKKRGIPDFEHIPPPPDPPPDRNYKEGQDPTPPPGYKK